MQLVHKIRVPEVFYKKGAPKSFLKFRGKHKSSHPEVFRQKSVLKYLEKFARKHLRWSLF